VHQSGSGRHVSEGVSFSAETFCDGFVLHGVLARGLQFNPQALDACQPLAVFFDSGPVGHAGSMRQTDSVNSRALAYTSPPKSSPGGQPSKGKET
jgi:hypothetical protein